MCNRYEEQQIRQEAASQAINKTIRLISERTNIPFPTVGTPSENRAAMIEILRRRFRYNPLCQLC